MAQDLLTTIPKDDRSQQWKEQRAACTKSLRSFMQAAWPVVETRQPLVWGWHMDAMVEHLEAITRGHIQRLVINVPPGSSKTLTVQVMWPAWEWVCDQHPRGPGCDHGFRPDIRTISATYAEALAVDKALICRRLCDSLWYQERFSDRWQRSRDQWGARKYTNLQGGWRLATAVGGQATGQHGDRKILDDPHKPQDIFGNQSEEKKSLQVAWTFWTQTMGLRDTGSRTASVVIMQRLHDNDVAQRCIDELEGYEVLVIPQRFERKHPTARTTTLERNTAGEPTKTWSDPRTDEGQLMSPGRFTEEAVRQRAIILGPAGTAAQEQQRPTPAGGAIYLEEYFAKRWKELPKGGTMLISVDATFKAINTSDYVAVGVWIGLAPDFYLIDLVNERMGLGATIETIVQLRAKWKRVGPIIVEDAANGPAVVEVLSQKLPGLQLVRPLGGKEARANATAVFHRTGNVVLPEDKHAPWVRPYIDQHIKFPKGSHDDMVDQQTQAINYLASNMVDYEALLETMKALGVR